MKHSPGARKIVNFSDSLHKQLSMYALAASAAGVGLLAFAQPVEAKIIYTPAHIGIGYRVGLDLNHDGITDFNFVRIGSFLESSLLMFEAAQNSNRVVVQGGWAEPLKGNRKVGRYSPFGSYGAMAGWSGASISHSWGPWLGVNKAYLGVKFMIGGEVHYGWARVRMTHARRIGAILTGYAYETIPNKPIYTWPIAEDDVEVPDPGPGASFRGPDAPQPVSLGMLALGARSVPLWRRKETLGTAQ